MIIGTFDTLKIGEVLTGNYTYTSEKDIQPLTCMILAKATKEDWLNYRKSMNLFIPYHEGYANYYKVSAD